MAFPTNSTGGGTSSQVIAPNLAQLARGIGHNFEVDFFDDAPTNSTPAVPANPAAHPAWSIVDPSGIETASGVGTPGSTPGRWNASWSVPPDAPLSTVSNKWRIVWNMVTQTSRQLQETLPFDVIELRTPDTLEDVRAMGYIVYVGNSERVVLRLPRRPDEMTVKGFQSSSLSNICPQETALFEGSLAGATITEVESQNLFEYYLDTPALTTPGQIQVVWNYRQTVTSPSDTTVQQIMVPPPAFWSLNPSLRTLIDKLQKRQGTIHAYTDADVFEYFQKGFGILNGTTPTTNWSWDSFPFTSMTTRFLVEAAATWAFNAQGLMEQELNFSFSGQTVTLDTTVGSYDEINQRLTERLTGDGKGSWPSAKVDMIRQMGPIAVVANRSMGRYSSYNYTLKLHSSRIGGSSPTLFDALGGPGIGVGFTLTDSLIFLNLV